MARRTVKPLLDIEEERKILEPIIAELSAMAGLEKIPTLEIFDPSEIRAGAYVVKAFLRPAVKKTALDEQPLTIAVIRGAATEATEPLMQSVLAHEIGHAKHRDADSVRRYHGHFDAQLQPALVATAAVVAEVVALARNAPVVVDGLILLFTVSALVWLRRRFVEAAALRRETESDADIFAAHLLGRELDEEHYFDNVPSPSGRGTHPRNDVRRQTFAAHMPCAEMLECKDGRKLLDKNY